jgi:cell division protein ZapA
MTGSRHSVRVQIFGEDYPLRTDADPQHTKDVAAYVDQAIRAVVEAGAVVEPHKAAILAALQITDELFKARAADAATAEKINALASEMRRWLPPAKRDSGSVASVAKDGGLE